MEEQRVRRIFTREQKFEILKNIEQCFTIKEGLERYELHHSTYRRWKRQLEAGVLRLSQPLKSEDLKRLEAENRKLKEFVLKQSLIIWELKKEIRMD